MSIFSNNTSPAHAPGLLARLTGHASAEKGIPTRKASYILAPENAPKTIRRNIDYPEDFVLYLFAGPMIEQVRCTDRNGEEVRCPALVARMVRKTEYFQGTMMGAKSLEEMTCSVRDLRIYRNMKTGLIGHPDADRIALELDEYYASKVASKERDSQDAIPETDFMHVGSNAFFHAMNPRDTTRR